MGENEGRAHVLMLAFPGHVHIAPLIQFARRLAFKGIQVTFASSLSATQSIQPGNHLISLLPTYDNLTRGLMGFIETFKSATTKILSDFINKSLQDSDERGQVKCLMYNADLPWALDIGEQRGLLGATFVTQTMGSTAAYYKLNLKVHEDVWKVGVNPKKNEERVCGKEEIERCLRELMCEEKGKEMKNLMQLKQHAKEALSEGGSSVKHIEAFSLGLFTGLLFPEFKEQDSLSEYFKLSHSKYI